MAFNKAKNKKKCQKERKEQTSSSRWIRNPPFRHPKRAHRKRCQSRVLVRRPQEPSKGDITLHLAASASQGLPRRQISMTSHSTCTLPALQMSEKLLHMELHILKTIIHNLAHCNRVSGGLVFKKWLEIIKGREPATVMLFLQEMRKIRKFQQVVG